MQRALQNGHRCQTVTAVFVTAMTCMRNVLLSSAPHVQTL